MSGISYIIIGIIILLFGTIGFGILQFYLIGKKKKIKEQYHIYE